MKFFKFAKPLLDRLDSHPYLVYLALSELAQALDMF
jgi:hypothetical protein